MNHEQELTISTNKVKLEGNLIFPEQAIGLVVFAHGSGSSRFSPRNRQVASYLNNHHLATLLFDLLTQEEEAVDLYTREYRFDIPMLAERLVGVTDWIKQQDNIKDFKLGYFGSSTGAAAALIAAAKRPESVDMVVSRGGRPDLGADFLPKVKAPTLLIVGGFDDVVIDLNKQAQAQMICETQLEIVPEATHLFEEPGKLENVCELATKWFVKYCG